MIVSQQILYTDMKSYVPAEGFIPTADIAVKIAECVLLEILWKGKYRKKNLFLLTW